MDKKTSRLRRATRTRRNYMNWVQLVLCVHRTPRHIYAQVITADGSKFWLLLLLLRKQLRAQLQYW